MRQFMNSKVIQKIFNFLSPQKRSKLRDKQVKLQFFTNLSAKIGIKKAQTNNKRLKRSNSIRSKQYYFCHYYMVIKVLAKKDMRKPDRGCQVNSN